MIKNHKLIATRYLKTWFIMDLVSIIPFELLPLPPTFRAMRLIRLLRLLKLARVLKASSVIARYETRMSMSYAQRDIIKIHAPVAEDRPQFARAWAYFRNKTHSTVNQIQLDLEHRS